MSVIAVMQNSDMIEGKLRWSDKFVVAAVNASRRFTPLRFDIKNLGPVTATYKDKTGWDSQANRPTFAERSVTLDNLQSIAWALPSGMRIPPNINKLDDAKAAGLPVIEGVPVSMKLAVEEGWYGKPGSKWQTELKHKMLAMRSGRYFGDLHAPDVVMGLGRTIEEERDIIDINPDGSYVGMPRPTENHPESSTQSQQGSSNTPPAGPPVCTDEQFAKRRDDWRKAILGGMSVKDLLVQIQTKFTLTEAQQMTLDSFAHEND